jgi:hypothetical protein
MQSQNGSENSLRAFGARLWRADHWLTGAGLIMLVALGAAIVGLAVDDRVVTGMPAWLKPAKFAASTAIYMLTLAWIFIYLPDRIRTRRIVGRATAVILLMEVAIIGLQAWRGTTSHFNVGTTLDAILFSLMGIGIFLQTAISVAVAVALWRQTFEDRAFGWALRLGLGMTIIGAMSGGLMTQPTAAQLDLMRATGRMPLAGAHTVGAPDGGQGLPGTGWSREHGDLRVPHFLGLHALQLLPLLVLTLGRRGFPETIRVRLTFVVAAGYFSLFGLLLWQALRGQSFIRPDAITIGVFTAWTVLTAVSLIAAARPWRSRTLAISY